MLRRDSHYKKKSKKDNLGLLYWLSRNRVNNVVDRIVMQIVVDNYPKLAVAIGVLSVCSLARFWLKTESTKQAQVCSPIPL